MAYQKKCTCYRCGGKGKGVVEWFQSDFDKSHPDWTAQVLCQICDGKGYSMYNFEPEKYKGKFKSVDWEKLDTIYTDFTSKYKCICEGELFFGGDGMLVCNCGRVYKLSIQLSVDETHLNDMKYWEEYNEKS